MKKQTLIDKLARQIKTLKEQLAGYDRFLELKGLLEECKKFVRPKSIVEKLQRNKWEIAKREVDMTQRKRSIKKHDIAI